MKSLTVLCIALALFTSCKKDADNCNQYQRTYTSKEKGMFTGAAYEPIPVPIYYGWPDGCGSRGYLEGEKEGNVTTVRAYAYVRGCDAICTGATVSFVDTFYFKASRPGTYYLKLMGWEETYEMDTVIVH